MSVFVIIVLSSCAFLGDPGEIAPEMLHRLCYHESRQIAAEKVCELFLSFVVFFLQIRENFAVSLFGV